MASISTENLQRFTGVKGKQLVQIKFSGYNRGIYIKICKHTIGGLQFGFIDYNDEVFLFEDEWRSKD